MNLNAPGYTPQNATAMSAQGNHGNGNNNNNNNSSSSSANHYSSGGMGAAGAAGVGVGAGARNVRYMTQQSNAVAYGGYSNNNMVCKF